jgi:hypothetical protein
MPRMRRAARERSHRPQLALGVWEWLRSGRQGYESLPVATRWDIFILNGADDWGGFWTAVIKAVENDDLEVSPDKVHKVGDPPLVPATRGTRFSSHRDTLPE